MRRATNGNYPTFALWENVPGAFSSNKGEDFRIVCEELIKIVEPSASMPPVPKNGWPYADSYRGDGWSLAYRVFDAQYWGVPQRRRRIHLVLDLRGERAREVLFERDGLHRNPPQGRTPWQAAAGDAEAGSGADDRAGAGAGNSGGRGLDAVGADIYNLAITGDIVGSLTAEGYSSTGSSPKVLVPCTLEPGIAAREGGHIYEGVSGTLRADAGDNRMAVAYSFDSLASNSMKSSNPHSGCRQVEVAKTLDTTDPNPSKNQGGIAIVEPVPYTLKIRSGCEGGGKGALIQTDKSATRSTLNDQYLFQPVPNLLLDDQGGQQVNVRADDKCPTLRAEAHGNVPAVVCKAYDARGNGDGETVSTITDDHENRITDYTSVVVEPIPIHDQATRFSGKRGDKSDGKGNGLGVGEPGDPMNTLTSGDRHAVAYLASGKETVGTLMANAGTKLWLGNQEAFSGDYHIIEEHERPAIRYIVRRLTPTECARLQGFADRWGDIDEKDTFTPEEFRFWHDVRNTHAAINGKKRQEYTEKQMLAWYNKLHTDSAEYKMWGNGIALPPALYCMQGMAEALGRETV